MEKINEEFNIADFVDSKRRQVIKNLNILGIYKYEITKDYIVNIDNNIFINNKTLEECPVVFGTIKGNFIWHFSNLKSLKNMPKIVTGNFIVANSKLISLEGSPESINGTFNCSNNKLKNLIGGPRSAGSYICMSNELESLKGSPIIVNLDFICSNNKLKSLKNGPSKVYGTFDCSNNEISSLSNMPICLKINYSNNPINKDIQLDIPFDFSYLKKDDEVIYEKPNSKWDKHVGKIILIEDITPEQSKHKYHIKFEMEKNKLLKDSTIIVVGDQYIRKTSDESRPTTIQSKEPFALSEGDKIESNGVRGDVKYIDEYGVCDVSFKNQSRSFKVHVSNLKKIISVKEIPIEKEKSSEKEKPIKTTEVPESRIKGKFRSGDKVIFHETNKKSLNHKYNNCIGNISVISDSTFGPVYSLQMKDKTGAFAYISNIEQSKLERYKEKIKKMTREEIPVEENDFKVGDKIQYIGNRKDHQGNELENCKGRVSYINNYVNNKSIELKLINYKGSESSLYNVDRDYVIRIDRENFKKDDKVIYENPNDRLLNNKVGIVSKKDDDTYNVIFNTSDCILTVTGIKSYRLKKYEITNVDFSIDDEVIYTKPDSVNYGCKGNIVSYDLNTDTYEIHLTSRDNRKVVVKGTKVENIKKDEIEREFKVGDKIRYVNSISPYTGYIGTIDKRIKDGKYPVMLKTKGGFIYIDANPDNLVLLEECDDSDKFVFGQKVIYKKPDSKWNDKIGEFQGVRQKDGRFEVKFDNTNNTTVKVYVDNEFLEPHGEIPKKTSGVITTYTNEPVNRKKKKKEKEDPPKPILVYNRRPVVGREGNRPKPPETKE